jgi:hypothetical protein
MSKRLFLLLTRRLESDERTVESGKRDALGTLHEQFDREVIVLGDTWNADKMKRRYNRPSADLNALRLYCHNLIAARRFAEAREVTVRLEAREAFERDEAERRRKCDYERAHERLVGKFRRLEESVEMLGESHLTKARVEHDRRARPLEQRLANLQREKDVAKREAARKPPVEEARPSGAVVVNRPLSLTAKLELSDLAPIPGGLVDSSG